MRNGSFEALNIINKTGAITLTLLQKAIATVWIKFVENKVFGSFMSDVFITVSALHFRVVYGVNLKQAAQSRESMEEVSLFLLRQANIIATQLSKQTKRQVSWKEHYSFQFAQAMKMAEYTNDQI